MQNMALAMAEAYEKQYNHLPDTDPVRFSSLMYLALSRYNIDDPDGAFSLFVRLQEIYHYYYSGDHGA